MDLHEILGSAFWFSIGFIGGYCFFHNYLFDDDDEDN